MTRPLGMPPTPSARSSPSEPVEVASTVSACDSPSFMIEPLPKDFSICDSAVSKALFLSMRISLTNHHHEAGEGAKPLAIPGMTLFEVTLHGLLTCANN